MTTTVQANANTNTHNTNTETNTYTKKEFNFQKYKAFFAFGEDQLNKQCEKFNINPKTDKLVQLPSFGGLITINDKDHIESLTSAFVEHNKRERNRELAIKGKERVIREQLDNYESYYTGDPTDAIEALEVYNISKDEVIEVFRNQSK